MSLNNDENLQKVNEEDKKVRYAILKVLGIVGLGVTGIGALGAGVGLALGAFGISMGIPVVGSALVTAGSWLATAIPALGAFGVALPIALGAIAGIRIAALAIFGIYKFVESLSTSKELPPQGNKSEIIDTQIPIKVLQADLNQNQYQNKIEMTKAQGKKVDNKEQGSGAQPIGQKPPEGAVPVPKQGIKEGNPEISGGNTKGGK